MKYLPIILIFIFSCSSKKDILFLQNTSSISEYDIKFSDIKIKPNDILRIKVSSRSPELASLFNFYQSQSTSNNLQTYQIDGFMVSSEGFVKLPSLDPVYVKDLTTNQASNEIETKLRDQGLLTNSTVDVKIVNSYFTVLGEVNSPGRYNFLKNDLNIFQAIGMAGDLTINGKRDDIRILRKIDSKIVVVNTNLTSDKIFSSENFQILPGDVIIVNPNNARVKNAGIIGNAGNLLSVLSFLLSSIILITSN